MDCAVNTYVIVLQGWFSLYIKVYFGRLWAGRPVFLFKHLLSWLSDLAKKNRFIFFFLLKTWLMLKAGRKFVCMLRCCSATKLHLESFKYQVHIASELILVVEVVVWNLLFKYCNLRRIVERCPSSVWLLCYLLLRSLYPSCFPPISSQLWISSVRPGVRQIEERWSKEDE